MAGSNIGSKLPSGVGNILLGVVIGANFNQVADVQIPLIDTPTKFRVRAITLTNGSINPTTARFGVFSGAGATGTTIVSASTTPSLATAATLQDLSIAATTSITSTGSIYLNLTTAQGAAATVDVYVWGDILSA